MNNIQKSYEHSVIRVESAKVDFNGDIAIEIVEVLPAAGLPGNGWHYLQKEVFVLRYRSMTEFVDYPWLKPYEQAALALWNIRDAMHAKHTQSS